MLSNGIHFALRKNVTAIEYTLTAGQKLFTFALYGSESLLKKHDTYLPVNTADHINYTSASSSIVPL